MTIKITNLSDGRLLKTIHYQLEHIPKVGEEVIWTDHFIRTCTNDNTETKYDITYYMEVMRIWHNLDKKEIELFVE